MAKLNSTTIYGRLDISGQVVSSVASGTPPFVISSTTVVPNLNVDMLEGYHGSTSATANTVVIRDTGGYIYATYFNSNRGNETSAAASYIYDTGDGWLRKKTLANAKTEIVTTAAVTTAFGASLTTTFSTTSDILVPSSKGIYTWVTGLGYTTSSGITSATLAAGATNGYVVLTTSAGTANVLVKGLNSMAYVADTGTTSITTVGTLSAGTIPWSLISSPPASYTPASHNQAILNGTPSTYPSFFAPATAGTTNSILSSAGSGAPIWTRDPQLHTIVFDDFAGTPSLIAGSLSRSGNGLFLGVGGTTAYALTVNFDNNYPDLYAIETLSGTIGLLRKTNTNTWTLDTAAYTTSSGVTSVSLAGGTNNGTLKLTVNGSTTDNIAVTGLGSAAYQAAYTAGTGLTLSAGNTFSFTAPLSSTTNTYLIGFNATDAASQPQLDARLYTSDGKYHSDGSVIHMPSSTLAMHMSGTNNEFYITSGANASLTISAYDNLRLSASYGNVYVANGNFKIKGSSTGGTLFSTDNAGTTNYVATLPLANGTLNVADTTTTASRILLSTSTAGQAIWSSTTIGAAAYSSITDSTSNSAISTGTSLTTERDVYYGLVTVNGASQTRATSIYAPITSGTSASYVLTGVSSGAPTWSLLSNIVTPKYAGIISATGTYALTTAAVNSLVYAGGVTTTSYANAVTIQLNYNIFSDGSQITIISNTAGTVTITPGTYVYINGLTSSVTITTKYKAITLVKYYDAGTNEYWSAIGV